MKKINYFKAIMIIAVIGTIITASGNNIELFVISTTIFISCAVVITINPKCLQV